MRRLLATFRVWRHAKGPRVRKMAIITIALVLALASGAATTAIAQNAKMLRGECIKLYKSWQTKEGYGAVAGTKNGHCGLSAGYTTLKEARSRALAECRKSRSKGCKIFAEKSRPGKAALSYRPNLKGKSEAVSLKAFQAKFGLSTDEMRKRFGAAGKVVCPWSSGTVFLVEQSDIIVTSDHIFIDTGKKGKPRGSISKCWVQFFFSKQRYSIKPSTVVHGFKTNKTAYQFVWYDWAVGQIDRPATDVVPLEAINLIPGDNVTVSVLSQGMNDSIPRVCTGLVTAAFGNYGLNEITTNCSTGPGASGGPVIIGSLESTPSLPLKVIALTWGTRSVDAETLNHSGMPISDGELQNALQKLLGNQGHLKAQNAPTIAPPLFELALQTLIESGGSCRVVYSLDNQFQSDISQISLSIAYTNDYGHPPISQVTKIERAPAGKSLRFEQTIPMLCRRMHEVAINSMHSAVQDIDYRSVESLMQNVALKSHANTIRIMKYNGTDKQKVQ